MTLVEHLPRKPDTVLTLYSCPSVVVGICSRTPADTKIRGCSSPLHTTAWNNAYSWPATSMGSQPWMEKTVFYPRLVKSSESKSVVDRKGWLNPRDPMRLMLLFILNLKIRKLGHRKVKSLVWNHTAESRLSAAEPAWPVFCIRSGSGIMNPVIPRPAPEELRDSCEMKNKGDYNTISPWLGSMDNPGAPDGYRAAKTEMIVFYHNLNF